MFTISNAYYYIEREFCPGAADTTGPEGGRQVSTELAWAAGFFEGEGCVSGTMHSSTYRIQLTMPQSGSPVLLERFQEAVGAGKICGPYLFKSQVNAKKPRWIWQAYGKNVPVVMSALAPYMSGPKQARYAELLAKAQEQSGGERTL